MVTLMRRYLLIFLVHCFSLICYSQQNYVDSLNAIINKTNIDTVKIKALKEIALNLYRKSPGEAEKYCKQCIELSESAEYNDGLIRCNNILGIINIIKTDYASALENFDISLQRALEVNDLLSVFRAYNNIGSVYVNLNNYPKAVDYYTLALKIAEKLNNQESIAQSCVNIAVIHKDNKDIAKAMEYNNKAIKIAKSIGNDQILSLVYGNISNILSSQNDYSGAIEYCKKGLYIADKSGDIYSIGVAYINLGDYFYKIYEEGISKKKENKIAYDSSIYYYNEAISLSKKLDDPQRLCNAIIGLGKISFSKKEYKKAKQYFIEVLDISKEIQNIDKEVEAYLFLSEIDYAIGDYRSAFQNYKQYKILNDSLTDASKMNSVSEMEIRYQTEKKQKQIEDLKKERTFQSEKAKHLLLVIALIAILLIISIIAFIMKRKDNNLLKGKNAEISKNREELQTQADYLSAANIEILKQQKLLQRNHKNITDSIKYASLIQNAVLPSEETLKGLLPNYFIFYKPRDIVSGDFYFAKLIKNNLYLAAADCTGHGVPGALLSMLGIALLNELVHKPEIEDASQVLNELRIQLKSSLQQTGLKAEQHDGIDISFCILNFQTNILNYSGAYNPIWIFRKDQELIELKADRQPVGIHLKEIPFTQKTIQLQKEDIVYLFSDGYYSQLGGITYEKFKSGRFKDLVKRIGSKEIEEQKLILENEFDLWKGKYDQTDDVLVVCFKV
jgi:serine phosphatase RsbU (regulator of sigma subunit)